MGSLPGGSPLAGARWVELVALPPPRPKRGKFGAESSPRVLPWDPSFQVVPSFQASTTSSGVPHPLLQFTLTSLTPQGACVLKLNESRVHICCLNVTLCNVLLCFFLPLLTICFTTPFRKPVSLSGIKIFLKKTTKKIPHVPLKGKSWGVGAEERLSPVKFSNKNDFLLSAAVS